VSGRLLVHGTLFHDPDSIVSRIEMETVRLFSHELVSRLQMRGEILWKIARSATKRGQHGPLLLKTSDDFS
jgi:hypothetical protein